MEFVEVTWRDAWADDDNFATVHGLTLTHKPMQVKTRGWLILNNEVGVSIANEQSKDVDDGSEVYRGRTFIPHAMVDSVVPYKLVKPRKPRPPT